MKYLVALFTLIVLVTSCKKMEKYKIACLVKEWNGKIIHYPDSMCLTSYSVDKIVTKCKWQKSPYTILNYVDTIGCFSCRLQLSKWKEIIEEFESIYPNKVKCLMVFYSKDKKQLIKILKKEHFNSFVYIDDNDTINKINKFLKREGFQTFLLNKDNQVIAMGNPVYNPKIKEFFKIIISNNELPLPSDAKLETTVAFDKQSVDMGIFDWSQERCGEFVLTNLGSELLIINDVVTSCGCIIVNYEKAPVQVGQNGVLKVKYKAERPEYFDKTISVYCNAKNSPIQLRIMGKAK